MEINTNYRLLLWGLSIIQPSSPQEVSNYLRVVLNDNGLLPGAEVMESHFIKLKDIGYIEQVSKRNNLFSVTPQGNEKLPPKLKKLRDKIRIFLLDKCYTQSKLALLASTETEKMGGDSPSLQFRHVLKEVPHPSLPWASGTLPSRPRQAWVRIYEQLKIGLTFGDEASTSSTDILSKEVKKDTLSLNFYSFNNFDYDYFNNNGVTIISSCLGISPGLLTTMIKSPDRYYRKFDLNKKNGKKRTILAPRKFIKVTQYWIMDHLLNRLKTHSSCYSYRKGVGIKENACNHLSMKFVANIDIVDYFGSINKTMIKKCFLDNKIPENIVDIIAGLVTYYGFLPQGAPTSPIISNAILHDFDESMCKSALHFNCVYTRYSDDITISGDCRDKVVSLIKVAEVLLRRNGFSVNDDKTRILSSNNRQIVTGILVNDSLRPTRKYRRNVRAAFDHAFKANDFSDDTLNELKGHLNYLRSFKKYGFDFCENKYKSIINELTKNKGS
jgi:hypothetical protein